MWKLLVCPAQAHIQTIKPTLLCRHQTAEGYDDPSGTDEPAQSPCYYAEATVCRSDGLVTTRAEMSSIRPRLLCRSQTAKCSDDPSGTDEQYKAKATVQTPESVNRMM